MKCIILRRRAISFVLCALIAVGMIVVVNHPVFVGASATTRQLPIYCVQQDYKVCALSFDAAWADVIIRSLRLGGSSISASPILVS